MTHDTPRVLGSHREITDVLDAALLAVRQRAIVRIIEIEQDLTEPRSIPHRLCQARRLEVYRCGIAAIDRELEWREANRPHGNHPGSE